MAENQKIFEIIVYDNNTGEIIYNGKSLPVKKIDFHWDYPDLPECKIEFNSIIV